MDGKTLKVKTWDEPTGGGTFRTVRLKAVAALHGYGEQTPYFSLTGDEEVRGIGGKWHLRCCGAMHGELLKHFPELAGLASLHLCDIDGVPMHAVPNGYYWLAGASDTGLGEAHHGGNERYRPRTKAECLTLLARHLRVSEDDARSIVEEVSAGADKKERLGIFTTIIDGMRSRWKAEANAVRETWVLEATKIRV